MKPTVVFSGQTETPQAFFDRYQRAARALRQLGVGEGDVVAMLMHNGPALLELMLATRWIGAHWCPINWHFKAEEVRYILGDSRASVLVAHAQLLSALDAPIHGDLPTFVVPREGATGIDAQPLPSGVASWPALRDAMAAGELPAAAPRGAMFYTSGTTGRPKGIRRNPATPDQVARSLGVMRHVLGFEPGMRALISAPMYHSAPNSYTIGASLDSGTLYIEPRFDAETTLRLIERHRISHAYLVPTMYARLLALPEPTRRRYDLSSMRFVASTGSPCPPDVKRAMIDWWGPVIHEAYGASELGYMTRLDSHEAMRKPGSAGAPLPGVSVRILDEDGNALPRGQAGLIYVRQPAFADFSYVSDASARERMERDGHLTMGDVGYLDDDGYLFIVDRSADMVISGGVNIYPAEIESVLQSMPGVADCALFGIPDREFGEALAAAVQCREGFELTADEVRAFLKHRLAHYKVPRVVEFHPGLPREDTGKIFKRKLREPYWQGVQRRI
jgi:long-chain acyl-CoA synthetase